MLIRPFTLSDVASFHRTLDAVARERRYLALLEAPPIGDTERYLRTALEQGAIHFVAEDDGRVVGWCDITPRQQPGSSHIGHLGMGLLHQYRGQGIGYRILEATVRKAFAKGLTRIDLEVFSSNQAAMALYRRYGFTIEGQRRKARHVDGMWDDIILMALEPGAVPVPTNPIINRIERQAATPGLTGILADLSAPDLQSLLLEVYRQKLSVVVLRRSWPSTPGTDSLVRHKEAPELSPGWSRSRTKTCRQISKHWNSRRFARLHLLRCRACGPGLERRDYFSTADLDCSTSGNFSMDL